MQVRQLIKRTLSVMYTCLICIFELGLSLRYVIIKIKLYNILKYVYMHLTFAVFFFLNKTSE